MAKARGYLGVVGFGLTYLFCGDGILKGGQEMRFEVIDLLLFQDFSTQTLRVQGDCQKFNPESGTHVVRASAMW